MGVSLYLIINLISIICSLNFLNRTQKETHFSCFNFHTFHAAFKCQLNNNKFNVLLFIITCKRSCHQLLDLSSGWWLEFLDCLIVELHWRMQSKWQQWSVRRDKRNEVWEGCRIIFNVWDMMVVGIISYLVMLIKLFLGGNLDSFYFEPP